MVVQNPIFRLPLQITLQMLAIMTGSVTGQTTEWIYHKTADGLHPDGNEQQLVWLMNRARANPVAEGLFLAASGDGGLNDGISYFGVNTTLLKSEFAAITPKPPAAFDRRIYEGSRVHSLDLIARNTQDHNNQTSRVTAAGFSFVSARASVFSYAESATTAHGSLNIDWGPGGTGGMQAGRGHRAAIMSDQAATLTNVGFAMVPETNPRTTIGPLVFSGAYCSAGGTAAGNFYNRFLTGTVWLDGNGNNRYDPDEGINGVTVQPDRGPFHAVTGVGGGWAIPITAPDTYNLVFSGSTLTSPVTRTALVGTTSVLLDLPYVPAPPAMTLTILPQRNGTLLLNWSGGKAPWRLQETTSLALPWTDWGAPLSVTSLTIPPSGPRRYYRVVGSP